MTAPATCTTEQFNELTDHYLQAFRAEALEEGALKASAMLTAVITHLCRINGEQATVERLNGFVTAIERFVLVMDGEPTASQAIN